MNSMVRVLSSFLFILLSISTIAQQEKADTIAIRILDRMSEVIGDMRSCRFKLTTATDVANADNVMIKQFAEYEVFLSGKNKMLINTTGQSGRKQYKYNGKVLSLYSFDENNYCVIAAPATTISTIDSLSACYGIDFPAADFFYPALTDDILAHSEFVRYLGIDHVNGSEYFHILASGKDIDVQIWVGNDAMNLPSKFVIAYKSQKGNPQYCASFSEWSVNPELSSALFEFFPPPGAALVKIISQYDR